MYFLPLCSKEFIQFTYSAASSLKLYESLYTKLASKGSVGPLWLDTIASTVSTKNHASLAVGCLIALNTLKVSSSSCTLNFNSPFCTSIIALPVTRNGLPSMIGIYLSSSISRTLKSARKMNLSTLTRTSSITLPPPPPPPPLGCFSDLSAYWSVTVVRRASPNLNRLNIDSGMRLIFSPRSHKTFSKLEFPVVHGMVKLPGSFNFYGSFHCRMALHSSVRFTVSKYDSLLFLDNISFMNFT